LDRWDFTAPRSRLALHLGGTQLALRRGVAAERLAQARARFDVVKESSMAIIVELLRAFPQYRRDTRVAAGCCPRPLVAAFIGLAGLGCSGADANSESTNRTTQALTTVVTLPVPVGYNPQDLTLGATGTISVNDAAAIVGLNGGWGDIAAKGTGTTSLGVNSVVHNAWIGGSLNLRQSTITGFYKIQGSVQAQTGTNLGDTDENRTGVPIVWDPIWTVSLSTPSSGADKSLSGGTLPLPPGNYGNVTINGGTLALSSGDYGFVNLTLNSGVSVTMPNPAPHIFINSTLVMHTSLVGTGLVVATPSANPISIEGSFHGDLFIAPNANIDIKADSMGHFFGKNITVFEGHRVLSSPLTQASINLLLPTPSVKNLGEMLPAGGGAGEISGAVVTPNVGTACGSTTRAFLSFWAADMYTADINATPAFFNGNELLLQPPAIPPASCVGGPVPYVEPTSQAYANWFAYTPRANAVPYYARSGGTDNLTARLSNGRVIEVGFGTRSCDGAPAQPASCPGSMPTAGSSCACGTYPDLCFYPRSPTDEDSRTWGVRCFHADSPTASCGAGDTGTWQQAVVGTEVGMPYLHMSNDCGSNWTAKMIDAYELGVTRPASEGPPAIVRGNDRPELYVDRFADRILVGASMKAVQEPDLAYGSRRVIIAVQPKSATDASQLSLSVFKNDPIDAAPVVYTSMNDSKARMPNGTFGSWVHVVTARCVGGSPLVEVNTPFGWRQVNLAQGRSADFNCGLAGTSPLVHNGVDNIRAVGISSLPPRVRVVYSAVRSDGKQQIHSFVVTIRSTNGYDQAAIQNQVVLEATVGTSSAHLLLPDLIGVDGLGGSDAVLDTPMVVRYTRMDANGDSVLDQVLPLFSGLLGTTTNLGSTSSLNTLSGGSCPGTPGSNGVYSSPCSSGDYEYGSFAEKKGAGVLRFFVPYVAQAQSVGGFTAHGSFVDITP
jgi:hypothetical protein